MRRAKDQYVLRMRKEKRHSLNRKLKACMRNVQNLQRRIFHVSKWCLPRDPSSIRRAMAQLARARKNMIDAEYWHHLAKVLHLTFTDQMEVIELLGYTLEEKRKIALKHLIPRVLEKHGISSQFLQIPEI
ncbi:uncharacterized protein LOC121969867 isoform X2 [Zingiber officinale]|uniref:uncharacterized protein LOC121969867 isoform X2 n=1 Tax=Zingiber officinale TaxID=94328 RepID=UPI001C4CC72E|nr:uncharacterized protein LOC121969867 isoform X2 [Zingiber officinale]